MPLGGYCVVCRRWVWVNPDGSCQAGHAASAVRDVQQLSPRRLQVLPPAERMPLVLGRRSRYRWWWRHSLWITLTFAYGLLSWLAFFYIGVRARSAAWVAAGVVYLLPAVALFASIGTAWLRPALAVQALSAAASVLHALLARPRYRAIMFGDVVRPGLEAPPQPPRLLQQIERPRLPHDVDETTAELIAGAHDRVQGILDAAVEIDKQHVREQVERLCRTAEKILSELAREPRQIELARAFLTYYLEAAYRIVERYADLLHRGQKSAEVEETLARAEASLQSIQRSFDQQLGALLQRDVIDLDSEIALLEKTVEMDSMMTGRPTSAHRRRQA